MLKKRKTHRDSAVLAGQLAALLHSIVLNTEIEKNGGNFPNNLTYIYIYIAMSGLAVTVSDCKVIDPGSIPHQSRDGVLLKNTRQKGHLAAKF